MNILDEMKVKGYVQRSKLYLEQPILTSKDKDLLEDILYHLLDIEEKGLSQELRGLRSKTLEQIATKRRLVDLK